MAFPSQFLDELIARNDIVDVVSGYVQLTKKSGSNMFGLCPFHSEKTPSFSVSPSKQIYHCFGCGKGGGVINFIMEIENLSFPDAVAFLARRVNMPVPDDDTPAETKSRRTRMLSLNRDAARFFYETLAKPEGRGAVEYIARRGIDKKTAVSFGLGAAPDSWSALTDAMLKKGYSAAELLDAGLVKRGKSGSVYDTFRNRLMFPVIDVRGSVIGFSGRILGEGEPKYLNSPDTLVFSKQRNLFALNLAKKTKMGMLILVEGNVDVVSLHQAGFDCAVASLGTSLTPDQARLMSRYTENVVIAYDSDNAGVKAADRAISLLEKTGVKVKVLRIPGAKDPDEFIKSRGPDAFRALLEKSENHIEYRLLTVKSKYDLSTDDGRIAYLAEATEMLSDVENAVEREIYGARVAETAGVSNEAVKNEIRKAYAKKRAAKKRRQEREALRPAAAAQPKERGLRYENVSSAAAEEGVIRLLMTDPALIRQTGGLDKSDFSSPYLAGIYEMIINRYGDGQNISLASVASELDSDGASRLTLIMQKPEDMAERSKAMADYIEKIKTEKLKESSKDDLLAVREKLREKKGYGG